MLYYMRKQPLAVAEPLVRVLSFQRVFQANTLYKSCVTI